MFNGGWGVYEIDNEIHVVPEDDIKEHVLDFTRCACSPVIDDTTNISVCINHNSFDHREQYEGLQ